MTVREHVSWKELTTFKVGGSVAYVCECQTREDVHEAVAFARSKKKSIVAIGEGSNVLPKDEDYAGVVLHIRTRGISEKEEEGAVLVRAEAGESWDSFVSYVTNCALWGVENLAGIPGTVGAAPVQNIGAYGTDVGQTLHAVEVLDMETGSTLTLPASKLALGYRDSIFKHEPRYVILSATFRLHTWGTPHIGYPDLMRAQEAGITLQHPNDIAAAVREIRRQKFPDLAAFGTAGSFFKNPVVTQEAFLELTRTHGALPSFPQGERVKIPLAFILDKLLSLKGYRAGKAFLFGNQPLVLVADRGADARDVEVLASEIEKKVFDATGIRIEREVRDVHAHELFFS